MQGGLRTLFLRIVTSAQVASKITYYSVFRGELGSGQMNILVKSDSFDIKLRSINAKISYGKRIVSISSERFLKSNGLINRTGIRDVG